MTQSEIRMKMLEATAQYQKDTLALASQSLELKTKYQGAINELTEACKALGHEKSDVLDRCVYCGEVLK